MRNGYNNGELLTLAYNYKSLVTMLKISNEEKTPMTVAVYGGLS